MPRGGSESSFAGRPVGHLVVSVMCQTRMPGVGSVLSRYVAGYVMFTGIFF